MLISTYKYFPNLPQILRDKGVFKKQKQRRTPFADVHKLCVIRGGGLGGGGLQAERHQRGGGLKIEFPRTGGGKARSRTMDSTRCRLKLLFHPPRAEMILIFLKGIFKFL